MDFTEKLDKLLKEKDISKPQLSKISSIPYSTIMSFYDSEKGTDNIKLSTLKKLSKALNVSLDYLTDDTISEEQFTSNAIPIPDTPVKVPIIGKISAGLPILAIENIEGYEFAPSSYIKEGFEYFYLRVSGDSMNLKFRNGDLVLVQKQDELENNEIGVILVNGFDATVKKFRCENGLVVLEPMSTNPEHQVQIYNPRDTAIKIIGKVVSYQGKL